MKYEKWRRRREWAREVFNDCRLSGDDDFFQLTRESVCALLEWADRLKYRKPRNANGSRGRYFYAMLQRDARRAYAGFVD